MLSIQELRSSNKKELLLELAKARKETLKVRINLKTKHDKDLSKAKKAKRFVAQILTMLKEIETGEQKNPKTQPVPARPGEVRTLKKTEKSKKEETSK